MQTNPGISDTEDLRDKDILPRIISNLKSLQSRGGGVIRDPAVWRRVLEEVRDAFLDKDAAMLDVMVSPLEGAHGNVEFLAHLRRGAGSSAGVPDLAGIVAEASARQGR